LKKLIIKGMGRRYFSKKVVEWYLANRRPLPWRETADPYRIWLSEVILQQTRVIQGLPYYQQFVEKYPTVYSLAGAREEEVLRLWQGLGYYTRARNLHKCAKAVVEHHDGRFPASFAELKTLPGIGHYTAAAIASFAFGECVAVLDGNVFRILSRIFGIETPVNSPEGKKQFGVLANGLIAETDPGLHNQGVMEFGALFCTPVKPRCHECPFNSSCVAFNQNMITLLPVKTKWKKARKRYFFYLVVEQEQSLLMKKRQQKDIWQGLFDFVLVEKDKPAKPENVIQEPEIQKWFHKTDDLTISKTYKHILTHQTIHCRFIHIRKKKALRLAEKGLSFYSHAEIEQLPKPVLISRFLQEQNNHC
jgi:A/G-specific adenine glycosylase